ncbi:MAG: type 4a pilus biogenesis protein PilO [Armatimonadetes bacterium]|nr:type 4a pilus biogenesis protein PilO [Armatimonadota bacterium]
MKLPVLNPNKRSITALAAAAAALFFAGLLVFTASSRNLKTAAMELENKQKQVADSRRIAQRLTEARQNYLSAQCELACLETSVATHAYIPTLLKQIERLATANDLKVVSIRPAQAPPAAPPPIKRTSQDPEAPEAAAKSNQPGGTQAEAAKPYNELQIEMQFEGKYWHARNLIFSLTRFPKIIAVNHINAGPKNVVTEHGAPDLLVKLNVSAFVFPEKNDPEAVDESLPSIVSDKSKAAAAAGRSSNEG